MVSTYKVTFLAAVPTMYQMMLTVLAGGASFDLSSLRVCHSGAAPMHETTFAEVESAFGAPVQEGYGQSEASSIVTSNPLKGVRKPGSIGLAIPGVTVDIVDETGEVLPPETIGELRFRGDTVMLGYWRRPELTDKVLRQDGLYSRDIGRKDADGYIFLEGRRDDLINVGGSKVYPQEVETVIYKHPAVQLCAVTAEASELYHQVVAAYVVLKPASQLSLNDLQKHCRECLADYKIPRSLYLLADIPKGPTGKILRHQLKPPVSAPS